MTILRIAAFVFAACSGTTLLAAAPAEPPPAGFGGLDYIDSRGCAYRRVELGEQTVWAERRSAGDTPVCGLVPSRAELSPSDALAAIPPNRRGTEPAFPEPGSYIQVGAFTGRTRADGYVVALQSAGLPVLRQDFKRGSGRLRVLFVGPISNEDRLSNAMDIVKGLGFTDAFVRGS